MFISKCRSCFLLFCAAITTVMSIMPANGQVNYELAYTFSGGPNDEFGWSVSGAGDVNNDGFDDVIIGARLADGNETRNGSATVISGVDGSTLFTFFGDSAHSRFGTSVSGAGDVNNDGFDDVIVGAYRGDISANNGSARVFSGFDGSVIYERNGASDGDFFSIVSGAGDINNDGFADFMVGAFGDDNNGTNSGSSTIFSGIDGSVMYSFDGDITSQFGVRLGSAGDVNNDGHLDIIVGGVTADNNGENSGNAKVFSGADGGLLYDLNGDSAGDQFGVVNGAGDVNNDGFDDVIVGAFLDDNNGTDSGSATVFSGIDGSILLTVHGDSAFDYFGAAVSGLGDVNGDGFDDFLVGAYRDDNTSNNSGSATIFSGMDGSKLFTFNGDGVNNLHGISVSAAGDVNGDGLPDFIVGASGGSFARVYVSSSIPEPGSGVLLCICSILIFCRRNPMK